jgi:hypothetical protein
MIHLKNYIQKVERHFEEADKITKNLQYNLNIQQNFNLIFKIFN